jgi:hypothetical protein
MCYDVCDHSTPILTSVMQLKFSWQPIRDNAHRAVIVYLGLPYQAIFYHYVIDSQHYASRSRAFDSSQEESL